MQHEDLCTILRRHTNISASWINVNRCVSFCFWVPGPGAVPSRAQLNDVRATQGSFPVLPAGQGLGQCKK